MQPLKSGRSHAGDTLIEVLVSMAVLGALVTVAYAVMSRGFASAQNSLDRTGTQAILSGQASLLRAAHARAVNDDPRYWNTITANTVSNVAVPDELDESKLADGCSTSLINNQRIKTFYLDPSATYDVANPLPTGPLAAKPYYLVQPPDDSKLTRQGGAPLLGDGIWIEGYRESNGFYTFYIKSCWQATYGDGSAISRQAKTIVRLYAP